MADYRQSCSNVDPRYRISSVSFTSYSAAEIEKLSCRKVFNPETFDTLLHPNPGGLYDPALGPTEKFDYCITCGLSFMQCPGHFGHISLPLPVLSPFFYKTAYLLFRSTCWCCHHLLSTTYRRHLLKGQLKLLEHGFTSEAVELESLINSDDATSMGESIQSLVNTFVQQCLERSPVPSASKTKHSWELKRQLISEFFKSCLLPKCPNCNAPVRPVRQENNIRMFHRPLSRKMATAWLRARNQPENQVPSEENLNPETRETLESCLQQKYISPLLAQQHLRAVFENERELLPLIFGTSSEQPEALGGTMADTFFLETVVVPPTKYRPISTMGDRKFENPQTMNLQKLLQDCVTLRDLIKEKDANQDQSTSANENVPKSTFAERLQFSWVKLQNDVNCFVDSDMDRSRSKDAASGIRQILEKKEGLFRKHMMGKRVNFAARSVISPDPYINMDEIGVPMVFATKLTYPQPVTAWNVTELRQAVVNGPCRHPGATHIENEDGSIVILSRQNVSQRQALAKRLLTPSSGFKGRKGSKKVYRHLKNGDVLLLNRQPTLHKPSIMAHKARVLPGERTLRLHYANCKTYNADFDGDEMNAHFPQNELARAEGYNIVATNHQYLVPKDGTPLSGLIQDHIVAGVVMTTRGRMFDRNTYHQLLYASIPQFHKSYSLLPPCIIKPKRLWSGKQVLSTVLLNILPSNVQKVNLVSKSKIGAREWIRGIPQDQRQWPEEEEDPIMSEEHVVFADGEFLCGVLDKAQFGPSQFGLVHACQELYGGAVAGQLLSALGRLFTGFLQLHGFTLGVEDILVTRKANRKRRKIMEKTATVGNKPVAEAFNVQDHKATVAIAAKYQSAHLNSDDSEMKLLDFHAKKATDQATNEINSVCMGSGLHRPFPRNSLQCMVLSGAKGSSVNCMQISCLLGQIELEGRRPPLMPSGRSLPSFTPYDTRLRARGFIDGRFLTGIKTQEYFFHCMAGREGLVDTAVKTSRSGYLQRCIIKHLEGIYVQYDQTVRDSDGSIIQFLYGEDGLDIHKTRYLTPKKFPFLILNYQALIDRLNPMAAEGKLNFTKAVKHQEKITKWKKKHTGEPMKQARYSGFLDYSEKHLREFSETTEAAELKKSWYSLPKEAKLKHFKAARPCPDPTLSCYSSDRHFGSIPERFLEELGNFIEGCQTFKEAENPHSDSTSSVTSERFSSLLQFKCLRSVADPGEAVGLLAAQSIGEPSTQMTLNTFHFAGRGEMNVTLGIPRLREILLVASRSIKTPSMSVPVKTSNVAREESLNLKKVLTQVPLSEVLEKAEVWESERVEEGTLLRHRLFRVKFNLLPHSTYEDMFSVTPKAAIEYIEKVFLKRLVSAISKTIKVACEKRNRSVTVEHVSGGKVGGAEEAEPDDVQAGLPDDEDAPSDLEGTEEDGTASRRRLQQMTYEEPDEEDEEIREAFSKNVEEDEEESVQSSSSSATPVEELLHDMNSQEGQSADRISGVQSISRHILGYSYDAIHDSWCQAVLKFPIQDSKLLLTSIIKRLAEKSVIHDTPGVKRGFLSEETLKDQKMLVLKTDGVNLQVMWSYHHIVDLTRLYTNNVHIMADVYGIEAAAKVIIKEIQDVFKVYGIQVDYRHLSLIADYMTFEGSYKPFNRIGMEAGCSPFQKMSFETTMHFLRSAAVSGDIDELKSPSACLVTGRVVNGGTGCCELLYPMS